MGAAPDATLAVGIVAAASSVATLVLSKWLESRQTDRRDAAVARRQADQDAKHDLDLCEITCNRLQEERATLLAEISYLRGKVDTLTPHRELP